MRVLEQSQPSIRQVWAPFVALSVTHGSAFLVLLILSSRLPPDDFGRLNSALIVQSYAVMIGACGLSTVLVRETARNPEHVPELCVAHHLITGVCGLMVCVTAHFFSSATMSRTPAEEVMARWLWLGAWFAIVTVAPFLDGLGRQLVSLKIAAVTEAGFLGCLGTGLVGNSLPEIGAAYAIKWIVAYFAHATVLGMLVGGFTFRIDWKIIGRLLKPTFPLTLATVINNLPITGTVLFVRSVKGSEEAAIAAIAAKFAIGFLVVAGVAFRYVQPRLRGAADLRDAMNLGYIRRIALMISAFWLCVLAGSCMITTLWLPPTYAQGIPTTIILLSASFFGAAAYLGWAILLAFDCEFLVFASYSCGAIVFLVSGWFLTRSLGHVGAASASFLSTSTTLFLVVWFVRQKVAFSK